MKNPIIPAFISVDDTRDIVEATKDFPSYHQPVLRYTKVRKGAFDPVLSLIHI